MGFPLPPLYRAASNYSEAALYQVIMLDTRALIPIVHLMYSAFSPRTLNVTMELA